MNMHVSPFASEVHILSNIIEYNQRWMILILILSIFGITDQRDFE